MRNIMSQSCCKFNCMPLEGLNRSVPFMLTTMLMSTVCHLLIVFILGPPQALLFWLMFTFDAFSGIQIGEVVLIC